MSELSNDSQNKKQRLGRGLGSLLGGSQPLSSIAQAPAQSVATQPVTTQPAAPKPAVEINPEARIWQVSIDKLFSGKYQPRKSFDKQSLEELAQSIKESGILQPIVAKKTPDNKFEIVAGERRWRAAQIAGLHEVPVILKTLSDQKTLELALIENIQREELNPVEEAKAYQRLIEEFALTQQQVAEKVGKDRASVANSIRLLNLPLAVQQMLVEARISAGHAKVLAGLNNPTRQLELAKEVESAKLSVRQLEKLANKKEDVKTSNEIAGGLNQNVTQRLISGLAEELQKMLGTKVAIDYQNSKGKISIHYYSDEELTEIVEKIKSGCQK